MSAHALMPLRGQHAQQGECAEKNMFNRPERDGASLMPPNHWYAIEHLPQDNDADDEGPANDGSAPAP